jgi:hypothetical protein
MRSSVSTCASNAPFRHHRLAWASAAVPTGGTSIYRSDVLSSIGRNALCLWPRLPTEKFRPPQREGVSGADIHTVAQLLGHKDLRMAARYQHLSPTFLAEAVNRLDTVFGDLRYPGVTAPRPLIEAEAVSALE